LNPWSGQALVIDRAKTSQKNRANNLKPLIPTTISFWPSKNFWKKTSKKSWTLDPDKHWFLTEQKLLKKNEQTILSLWSRQPLVLDRVRTFEKKPANNLEPLIRTSIGFWPSKNFSKKTSKQSWAIDPDNHWFLTEQELLKKNEQTILSHWSRQPLVLDRARTSKKNQQRVLSPGSGQALVLDRARTSKKKTSKES
jgi:hypothetical protein